MDNKTELDYQKEITDYKTRFTRWQQLSISQLSATNNLFLTFTTGLLAFSVTQTGLKVATNCLLTFGVVFSYLFLVIALVTGAALTINRLTDFRKTKELVRQRRQKFETERNIQAHGDIDKIKKSISDLEAQTIKHGKDTWDLLNWQVITFTIGAVLMLTIIVLTKN
ncbi:MAG: hypothetical protein Q8M15_14380 [Bacteroidota bacterium]|nr:hypothetical protein [Bacteroidota bacterium]